MFIQTESTPNPATLKFLPGKAVMQNGTANFAEASEAQRSPIATRLFAIEGVAGVFLGADFVTVTKTDDRDWDVLRPQVLGGIMEHYQSGRPMIEEAAGDDDTPAGDDDPIVKQIKELIDTRVRRLPELDGDPEARHREHAALLRAGSSGSPGGRIIRGIPRFKPP